MQNPLNEFTLSPNHTLRQSLDIQQELTEQQLNKVNRKTKRNKLYKTLLTIFGTTTLVAQSSVAKAGSLVDKPLDSITDSVGNKVIDGMMNKLSNSTLATDGTPKEHSLMWTLNEFASSTILTTKDYFGSPEIVQMFSTVWYIVMSFSTILIAKKGFDMVKARTMGSNSLGLGEMLIRLLSSLLFTFLSLDIIRLGIKGSNMLVQVLFNNLSQGFLTVEQMMGQSFLGLEQLFWTIGYIVLFCILLVRYWIRQIELVILGLVAPIASMSYVVDGGRMLGTLAKEIVQLLLTPIVHGALLLVGTVLIQQVSANETGPMAVVNSIGISLATMVIMIVTPDFLRKFTHGSANPIKFIVDLALGAKAMPGRMKGAMS